MNEDLSNVMNQFSNILKEKNIDLNKIINKASDNSDKPTNSDSNQDSFSSNNQNDFNLDIETILKIKNIMQQMNQKMLPETIY